MTPDLAAPTLIAPDLVDSHCHLDFPDFEGEVPALITRAAAAGVTRLVTICTRLRHEPRVRAIADAYPNVFYAAGTHPMHAADEPLATVAELVALAAHPKFVGIGETGLDYHYTADSKAIQQTSLMVHIEAAQETQLPLIIHARGADDDMAEIGFLPVVIRQCAVVHDLEQHVEDVGVRLLNFVEQQHGVGRLANGFS